jgi:Protein of unknown function (DUF1592)/Protein of unknown function (DUF1588)/Protein of unknown function (DUF1587)/Protein of unknown function (DUF1585)/Protein of unknown function (DUF1595)
MYIGLASRWESASGAAMTSFYGRSGGDNVWNVAETWTKLAGPAYNFGHFKPMIHDAGQARGTGTLNARVRESSSPAALVPVGEIRSRNSPSKQKTGAVVKMNRRLCAFLVLSILSWSTYRLAGVRAQDQSTPSSQAAVPSAPAVAPSAHTLEDFQQRVLPFVKANCEVCHNAKLVTGGLNFEAYPDAATAIKHPEIWKMALKKLKAGEMPPTGLSDSEKTKLPGVEESISTTFGIAEPAPASTVPDGDPGRMTMRRLNHAEYDNTIRDLLGVYGDPAKDFPVDDSGYGFNNNGDVLSLSPLLMEKYITEAETLSKLVVDGPELPAKPQTLITFIPSTGPDAFSNSSMPNSLVLPYSLRGLVASTWDFPKDATYEFAFHTRDWRGFLGGQINAGAANESNQQNNWSHKPTAAERRLRGTAQDRANRRAAAMKRFPPAMWALWVDGKIVLQGEHAGGYGIDAGDSPEHEARIRLTAGPHTFQVGFVDAVNFPDPMDNLLKGKNFKANDGLHVFEISKVEIRGPYQPSSAPLLSYRKVFICQTQDNACARQIVTNLANRAFRRPATQAEVTQLMGIYVLTERQGKSFKDGIRNVLETVLMSPDFLFEIERDPKPEYTQTAGFRTASYTTRMPATDIHRINDYELASRLSYFIWSSMPDDELFTRAKDHTLHQPAVLHAEVKRMLADPKAKALQDNFAAQWLGIMDMLRSPPDPDIFPEVDASLLHDEATETELFFASVIKNDSSIFDFINGNYTYLNQQLADFYGIPGVKGNQFRRVDLTGNPERSGILTDASILTVSAFPTRTSVVTRGKWVLDNLLGTPPPPPPPNVPSLSTVGLGKSVTLRQQMEAHRKNPVCAACHTRMDPIGFGLEHYDASGKWRTMDGRFPVDSRGTLPDGRSFDGAGGLKKILLSDKDLFARNLTVKMMTYALGRGLEPYDDATINNIVNQLKTNDYKMDTLLYAIVDSKPFQMRDGDLR